MNADQAVYVQLLVAGIATGATYSLAAMGVILTYRATGIFNFAHGAIATLVAYALWQMSTEWGWPFWVSVPLALLVLAPGIGLILERLVFRPLQQARAGSSEKLVATLGVFTVVLALIYVVWGGEVRSGVPRLFSPRPLKVNDDLSIGFDQLATVILVIAISAALWFLLVRTRAGVQMRAVVDRRELAELSSINANRVAGMAWALGCAFAGLTGVLLAPTRGGLQPFPLTLLVIETFSIAVVARLASLPLAVAGGVGLLGMGQAMLNHWEIKGAIERLNQLKPNLSVVILFVFLLIYRRLDEPGEDRGLAASLGAGGRPALSPRARVVLVSIAAVAGLAVPLILDPFDLLYAQRTVALAVIFVSLVCVTGFSGNISLGHAAFAGAGAFFSARAANSLDLPIPLAMLVGGLFALVLGIIAGYPALKRQGLFLGLTTLSLGLLVYRFVFDSEVFRGGAGGLTVHRPSLVSGGRAFYWFELACLVAALVLARNLRQGRLGRILSAMRDSQTGARSVGIDLRQYKLFIFGISAFMAGIGGALLSQQEGAFESGSFDPFTSLFWFTVVVVAGLGSIAAAVFGAIVYVMLPVILGTDPDAARFLIGVAALSVGRVPGGVAGLMARLVAWLRNPRGLMVVYQRARAGPPPATEPLELTPFADRVLQETSQ